MQKATLKIETPLGSQTAALEDELSIGRTNQADIAIDDVGLSRVNTTFFRDGDKVFVVDENSLNGTFLNGEKITEPTRILDGDLIKIGSETRIFIGIQDDKASAGIRQPEISGEGQKPETEGQTKNPKSKIQNPKSDAPPFVLIAAAVAAFFIIFGALIVILIVKRYENSSERGNTRPTPPILKNIPIPVRLIDPLGGQTPEELQELSQYWEVPEKEIEVSDLQDINVSAPVDSKSPGADTLPNLKVSVDFWRQQREKALAPRSSPTGISPPGLRNDLRELCCGVPKQTAKLAIMLTRAPPYQQPMDFADLASKKMKRELMELPMATDDYVLEVGGSSTSEEFTSFDFQTGSVKIAPGTTDYMILAQLASNFSGEKYDLDKPDDRRQMKIRLLRMFHPNAFDLLNTLAKAYRQKFNRPLRVTSLTRSMEYQISLNRTNPNSFKVRGAGSLPPHTSGCAFDLSRKQMTAEEQNFMMEELVKLERAGKLDALIEGNLNACFHVFIYDDGIAPKM